MQGLGFGFFLIFMLNFGISWFNAWAVGKMWLESKATGGFQHFVTWCAAIMSACGFTWCYSFVLAFIAGSVPYHGHPLLAPKYVAGVIELSYLIIILPVIGSGIGITISSWQNFRRERNFANGAVAGYNTFAQIYNTVQAVRAVPAVFGDLGKLFKGGDSKDSSIKLMILLVVLAVIGGIGTTFAIVRASAKAKAYEVQAELAAARA